MHPIPDTFYLAYIQTPQGGHHIALRESPEDAQEDVQQYAQAHWQEQFPGSAMPGSKAEVIEQYFQAGPEKISFDIVNFHPMGQIGTGQKSQPSNQVSSAFQ